MESEYWYRRKMKEYVTKIKRGDRLMTVKLIYGECTINAVSAYVPQSGATDKEKEQLWRILETEMERLVLGADLIGYVGAENEEIERDTWR